MSEREIVAGLRRCVSEEIDAGCDCPQCLELRPFVAAADTYLRETAQAGAVRRPDTDCGGEQHFCGPGCKLAPEAVAAPGDTPALTKFDYLLNAMEAAGQADVPAAHGYGDKRLALYAHIRRLEADANRLAAAESRAAEVAERLAAVERELATTKAHRDVLNELTEQHGNAFKRATLLLETAPLVLADRDRLAAALAQREGEVATVRDETRRACAAELRDVRRLLGITGYPVVEVRYLTALADRWDPPAERGPTPPDGEG